MADLLAYIECRTTAPLPDCQIWTGANDRGYGRIYVDGRSARVHRVVWELKNGPIPDGLTIDHLCRVRACINTDHMELVSGAENTSRAAPFRPRVSPRQKSTHCKVGHEFTPENSGSNGGGRRICLTCRRNKDEARRQASDQDGDPDQPTPERQVGEAPPGIGAGSDRAAS